MQRRKIKIKVYSKVNLSLNILGVKDGMHELDMVLTSAGFADVITVCERLDDVVNIEFAGGENFGSGNSAAKAADVLRGQFGPLGADIFIEKGIPQAAGLGGSSADAAGVMCAFDILYGLTSKGLKMPFAALKTGSDVPYMLSGGFARVLGTGGQVQKFFSKTPLNMVVANSGAGVSTKDSYALFDKLYPLKKLELSDNSKLVSALSQGDLNGAVKQFSNALEKGSVLLEASVGLTKAAIESTGALKAFMTGSGSACAGIYEDFDKALSAQRELIKKGFAAKAAQSLETGIEIL